MTVLEFIIGVGKYLGFAVCALLLLLLAAVVFLAFSIGLIRVFKFLIDYIINHL